jgi:hypothetical protein
MTIEDGPRTFTGPVRFLNKLFFHDDVTLIDAGVVEKYASFGAGSLVRDASTSPADDGRLNNFPVLLFASNGTEYAFYAFHVPKDWAVGTDMKLAIYWAPTSGAAGGVAWEIRWEARASNANEVIGAGYTDVDLHDATEELENELLETGYGIIAGSALAVDDTIGIRISRDHDDAIDNYGADAALVHIEIEYKADKLGEKE